MRYFYIILLTLLILPCASNAEEARLRTITVQGQAEQEFNPDIAKFSVNILGKAATRNDAKAMHDKLLKTLMELTKKYEIAENDLSTGFSSVNPNYEYPNGKRKFIDYNAQTQINITIRNLKNVGTFQDSLITAGFDNFQGPNYTLDKMFTYNDKVLTEAIKNAKEKATNIAASLGETLDKPVDIREEGTPQYAPQPMFHAKTMAMSAVADSAIAQPSGIINIRSGVVATFSLK